MNSKKMEKIFLEPSGDNLKDFTKAMEIAIEGLRLWWKEGCPIPSKSDIRLRKKDIERLIEKTPLPYGYEHVKDLLLELTSAIRFNNRNFVNIHPSPVLPSIIAITLISIQNPNNIVEEVSPATTEMERECIKILAEDFIGFDPKFEPSGNIVTDGTIANLTALLVARDKLYETLHEPLSKWHDSNGEGTWTSNYGLFGEKPSIVISTRNDHYSVKKSLWILGLGAENYIRVPVAVDEELLYRTDLAITENRIDELEAFYNGEPNPFSLQPLKDVLLNIIDRSVEAGKPILSIVLTFGTTETGTLEDMDLVTEIKNKYSDVWVHVDAAIGGFALAVEEVRKRGKGIESADSVIIDPHKFGYMAYPSGAVIFRRKIDHELIHHSAPYLRGLAPTIEGSRPGTHAGALWVALKTLGLEGYNQIISKLINLTRELSDMLTDTHLFQPLHIVDLNTLCFSIYQPGENRRRLNMLNDRLFKRINMEGKFFINKIEDLSGIKVKANPFLKSPTKRDLVKISGIRMLVMNPLTEYKDLEEFVNELKDIAKRIIW